jgi:hypothetical protein
MAKWLRVAFHGGRDALQTTSSGGDTRARSGCWSVPYRIPWQRRRDTRAALRLMRKLAQEARLRAEIAGHRQAALLRLRVPASSTDLSA